MLLGLWAEIWTKHFTSTKQCDRGLQTPQSHLWGWYYHLMDLTAFLVEELLRISLYVPPHPPLWRNSPQWAMASSLSRFLDHTQRRIAVGRTPLNEWSARRRDLYLTTHNIHNRIRTHTLSRRAAADLRLRPRGYRDRHLFYFTVTK